MNPLFARWLSLVSASVAAGVLVAGPAQAAPVTYVFTGSVLSDEADRGYAAFAGSFSFDSSTVDGISDPTTAAYAHSSAPWGLSITFDAEPALVVDSSFNVLVSNDLGGTDALGVLAQDAAQSFSLTLQDFSASIFSSDALPLPPGGLSLASFGWTELRWESLAGTLQGSLSSLQCIAGCDSPGPTPAIPEPASLPLALAGLAALRAASASRTALLRSAA